MNLIECGSRKGWKKHYIDLGMYEKVSESKSLCGKEGKELIVYDAIFFNYDAIYSTKCLKCEKIKQDSIK